MNGADKKYGACRERKERWNESGQVELPHARDALSYWAQTPSPLFPFLGCVWWGGGTQGLIIPCSPSNSLCSQVWLWMFYPFASSSQVLKLQACTTTFMHVVLRIQPRTSCMLGKNSYLLSYTMALFSLSLVWKGLFELSKLVLNSFLAQGGLELEILLPLVPK